MKDIDFAQIVIFKKFGESQCQKLKGVDGEDLTLIGKPSFIYHIEQILGHFRISNYGRPFYQRKEMEILENKTRYLVKLTGFFFLQEDYKEKLTNIVKILNSEGLSFHLTRLDLAWTLSEVSYDEFCRLLIKVRYSDTIERTLRDKKKRLTRIIFWNSRFMAICYNKQSHIQQVKKRDAEYRNLFEKKYQSSPIRFEYRLISKSELVPMTVLLRTDPQRFFNEFPGYAIEKSKGRLTFFPLKLRKILFNTHQTKGGV